MAAQHSQLVIPVLLKSERIEDWRLGFEAGIQPLVEREDGDRKALQLLPAYINRDIADREAVRDVTKNTPTVKEALDKLSKLLDPPVDQFSALQELGGMQCNQVKISVNIFSQSNVKPITQRWG